MSAVCTTLANDPIGERSTGGCRWVDVRPPPLAPAALDAWLIERGLPLLTGRLVDCAGRRPRVECHEDGALLVVVPVDALDRAPPLALLVHGDLLVTLDAVAAPALAALWSTPLDADARQLAATLLAATLTGAASATPDPLQQAVRARVLASQREVVEQLAAHLPLAPARAALARATAALAHDRARERVLVSAAHRPAPAHARLVRRVAPVVVSLVACAASALVRFHLTAFVVAHVGLVVSLLTL